MHDETERAEAQAEDAAPTGRSEAASDSPEAPEDAGAGDGSPEEASAAAADDSEGEEAPEAGDDEAAEGEAELKDQLLRALADTENARRRARKDVDDARAYAISRFAEDLLAVADNLGRALESIPAEQRADDEAVKAIADGVEMTARQLEAVLSRHGITKIDPLGEKFDYNLHQALFETADTDQPDGTVVQVAQTGYTIGDRLLRAAMVGIAKGGTPPASATDAAAGEDTEAEAEADAAEAPADEPA